MKSTRILFILFCCIALIQSEIKAQEGISIGVKAGYGYSQFFFQENNVEKNVEQNFVPVFQYGLVISHRNDKNFGIQLEILQTQNAWEEKFLNSVTKRVKIDYLEIPFLASYKIGKKRKSGVVITAGLHFSFIQNIDSIVNGQYDTTIVPIKIPMDFEYGLGAGLGYQLVIGRSIIQLDAFYSQGLQNLFDRDYLGIYRSLSQSLYLNISYKISLARKKKTLPEIKATL